MNIALIDDEKFYRNKISKLLQMHFPSYNVIAFCCTEELLKSGAQFDILLLDIELSEENGVTFAKNNIHKYQHIIYVTSHTEQIFDAFDHNILGFIPKNKIDEMLIPKILEIEERMKESLSYRFNTVKGIVYLQKKDILYFDIEEETITLHTLYGELRLTYTSLQKVLTIVKDGFYFSNRNCLVNIHHIHIFNKNTHDIVLTNNHVLNVSHRRWKELLKHFNEEVDV